MDGTGALGLNAVQIVLQIVLGWVEEEEALFSALACPSHSSMKALNEVLPCLQCNRHRNN